MKTIVVPTDFSECAKNALRVAAEIAKKSNATIHLVHVYERPVYGFVDLYIDHDRNHEIRAEIERRIPILAKEEFLNGVNIKIDLLSDIEIWQIPRHKILRGADLIVMGSHGCKGLKELFIGSNTEKVVRVADMPVLVIKERYDKFEVKNMVFASNFQEESIISFLKIKRLAQILNPVIHLLKVNTRVEFEKTSVTKNLMHAFVKRFNLENYTTEMYYDDTVEDGIIHFSKVIKADIIAIETHGRTGLAHLINGSITENLVNHLSLPVLSIKMRKEMLHHSVGVTAHTRSDRKV